MSHRVLHQVVADLRPKIIPKLRAESDAHMGPGPAPANAKRGTVDVLRGDTYQFAYFLRETEPHSILIKVRFLYELPAVSSYTLRQETSCSMQSLRRRHQIVLPRNKWTGRRGTLPESTDVGRLPRG